MTAIHQAVYIYSVAPLQRAFRLYIALELSYLYLSNTTRVVQYFKIDVVEILFKESVDWKN